MKKMFFLGAALAAIALLVGCQTLGLDDVLGFGKGSSSDTSRAAGGCGDPFAVPGSSERSSGQSVAVDWPDDSDWSNYGLAGLKQPAGSKVVSVALYQGVYYVGMEEAGREAYNDLVAQVKKITGATAPYSQVKAEDSEMSEYQYGNHIVALAVNFVNKDLVLRVLR